MPKDPKLVKSLGANGRQSQMGYKENGRQQLLITRYAVGLRPGIQKS